MRIFHRKDKKIIKNEFWKTIIFFTDLLYSYFIVNIFIKGFKPIDSNYQVISFAWLHPNKSVRVSHNSSWTKKKKKKLF